MSRPRELPTLFATLCLVAICGCASTAEIRVENISDLDFTDLRIAGVPYGEVGAGETSEYRTVKLKLGYVAMRLRANGRGITGQTLNFGARRFTYRIAVKDLAKRHLAIEIIRERPRPGWPVSAAGSCTGR